MDPRQGSSKYRNNKYKKETVENLMKSASGFSMSATAMAAAFWLESFLALIGAAGHG